MADNIIADGGVQLGKAFAESAVELLKVALPPVLKAMFGQAGPAAGQAITDSAKGAIPAITKSIASSIESLGQIGINAELNFDMGHIQETFEKIKKEGLMAVFDNTPLKWFMDAVVKVDPSSGDDMTKSIQSMMSGLGEVIAPVIAPDFIGKSLLANGLQNVPTIIANIRKHLGPLESKWSELNKTAASLSVGFNHASNGAYSDLSNDILAYQQILLNSVNKTGISQEEFKSLSGTLAHADIDVIKLANDTEYMTRTTRQSSTAATSLGNALGNDAAGGMKKAASAGDLLTNIMMATKGSGLENIDIAKDLAFYTKELGHSNEEALGKVGLFADAQAGTRLTIRETRTAINQSTTSLKYFGDTSQAVAKTFSRFAQTLAKEGKEGLAMGLMQQVTEGIGNLDMAKKAFLATTSGMGGGDAIKGGLELEEAMASGDQNAIDNVMNRVTEQIEKISGSKIISRKEALATGKSSQLYMQRELFKQFGLAGNNDAQAETLQETIANGRGINLANIGQGKMNEQIMTKGKAYVNNTVSSPEAAENIAQANADIAGIQSIGKSLASSTDNLMKFSETMESFGKNFVDYLEHPSTFKQRQDDKKNTHNREIEVIGKVDGYGKTANAPADPNRKTAAEIAKEAKGKADAQGKNSIQLAGEQKRQSDARGLNSLDVAENKKRETVLSGDSGAEIAAEKIRDDEQRSNMMKAYMAQQKADEKNRQQPAPNAIQTPLNQVPVTPQPPSANLAGKDNGDSVAQKIGMAVASQMKTVFANFDPSKMQPQFDIKVSIGNEQLKDMIRQEIKRTTP